MRLRRCSHFTIEDVQRVAQDSSKQRFHRRSRGQGLELRANNGHSRRTGEVVQDDALLQQVTSVAELEHNDTCVHGTNLVNWNLIRREGLRTIGRSHVHFVARTAQLGGIHEV